MRVPRLALVCDSGPGVGSGHLVRQLSVGVEWIRVGGSVSLTTPGPLPSWLLDRYQGACISIVDRPPSTADVVLFDSYRLDLDQVAHTTTRALTVIADDFSQLPSHPSKVVLDHNVGATTDDYQDCSTFTHFLVGSSFALVRPEFVSARSNRGEHERADGPLRVLIALGGDPNPADLDDLQSSIRLRLPDAEQLIATGSVSDMALLMSQADFAVSASGSTVYELCALGVPSVVIPIVKNQQRIASEMQKAGAVVLSDLARAAKDLAALTIDQRRSTALSASARSLIDGQGPVRVVAKLRSLLNTADGVPLSSD